MAKTGILARGRTLEGVRAEEPGSIASAIARCRPDAIINAIGLVKQAENAGDWAAAAEVNSVLPHRLAAMAQAANARLLHVSTDCVFSGRRGHYTETDDPDAQDVYGKSKLAGEVAGPGCVTFRTSIIGRELRARRGLMEWLFAQDGKEVKGYRNAIFSGLPTVEIADVLRDVIQKHPAVNGIYHLSADPVSKYDLLTGVVQRAGLDIRVEANEDVVVDRSLDSSRLRALLGWAPPGWPELIKRLVDDAHPYREWRRTT